MNRRAQIWTLDLFIALIIFLGGIIFFFQFVVSTPVSQTDSLDTLQLNADLLSNYILSQGQPHNWTAQTVTRVGLLQGDQRINETLLVQAAGINYTVLKTLLGVNRDFFVYFEDEDGKIINFGGNIGIGSNQVVLNSTTKTAFYSQQDTDNEMQDFFINLSADIFWKKEELPALMATVDDYDFIFIEDCHCDKVDDALETFEAWTAAGGILFVSEHYNNSFPNAVMGVLTDKGTKIQPTDAAVTATDSIIDLTLGEEFEFASDVIVLEDDPATADAINFKMIANWTGNADEDDQGKASIATWGYGSGRVYYFSDYHGTYDGEEITGIVEVAVQTQIDLEGFIQIDETFENFVKIERLAVYKSKLVRMVVFVWQ